MSVRLDEYDGVIKAMRRTYDADTFIYDKASRIKEGRLYVGAYNTLSYTYDGWGNLLSTTTNGGNPSNWGVDPYGSNRMTGASYDEAGNMTQWGAGDTTFTYAYYPTNQMKTMMD